MNALKKRRLHSEIPTQVEVAKALGVRGAAVSKWENGRSKPRAKLLPAIAKLYGCTIDELLDDNPDSEESTEEQNT